MCDGRRGNQQETSNEDPSVAFWRNSPMHRIFLAAGFVMAGLLSFGHAVLAQDASQPVYIVTYVEVVPSSVADARQLILNYANEARKASGAVAAEALQRISDPNHFALIEQWQSQAAKQAFAATPSVLRSTPCRARPMTSAFMQLFRSARRSRFRVMPS